MKGIAWITGASQGIGKHVALELSRQGWVVALTSRGISDLNKLVDEINATHEKSAFSFPGDITNTNTIDSIIECIEAELGPIDIAILNAGTYIRFGIGEFKPELFEKQININVMGTVNCLSSILPSMLKRKTGRIAIVSSLSGYRGLPYASAYGASKAALINMCESLKPELDAAGITISVINPGFVKTPLTNKNEFRMPFLVDGDIAGKIIVKGVLKGKFEIAFPLFFALILKFLQRVPYFFYFFLTRKLINKK